jgi:hypothetical protein
MNPFIDLVMDIILWFLVLAECVIIIGITSLVVYGLYKGIQIVWKKRKRAV